MAKIAFPSENAVGTLFGSTTQVLRELALAKLALAANSSTLKSYVVSGFDVTAISASNGVRLSYGSGGHFAIINGTVISFDADVDLTGLSNATHYIYAQLSRSSSLVTDWVLTSNTTGTPPSDSVQLARVVVTGGVAGSPTNSAKNPATAMGTYTGDSSGTGSQTIFVGFSPRVVLITGTIFRDGGGSTYQGISFSAFGAGGMKFAMALSATTGQVLGGTNNYFGGDPTANGFTVNNSSAGNPSNTLNWNGQTYSYLAIP